MIKTRCLVGRGQRGAPFAPLRHDDVPLGAAGPPFLDAFRHLPHDRETVMFDRPRAAAPRQPHGLPHSSVEFVLNRDEAYIGVLIDDLVTKGVDEPYRMFTSRAEYRILLRQDDADMRLTPKGFQIGLVTNNRHKIYLDKIEKRDLLIDFIKNFSVKPDEINSFLLSLNTAPIRQGMKLVDILSRPQVGLLALIDVLPSLNNFIGEFVLRDEIIEAAEISIKYSGYIERERMLADKLSRLENLVIAGKFNYEELTNLSIEARQKLSKIQPRTIGQASRISGVSPADINVLLILMGR